MEYASFPTKTAMRSTPYILGIAISALLWTGPGQSYEPRFDLAALPLDVVGECHTATRPAFGASCDRTDYRTQWVGRLPQEELFLITRRACRPDGCRAWLVGRDDSGRTRTLLTLTGALRFEHGKEQLLPVVHTRLELGDHTSYDRYEWDGVHYVLSETRLVHRVDDFECPDETVCRGAAEEALRRGQADRAVRIWQQVHGVNWI